MPATAIGYHKRVRRLLAIATLIAGIAAAIHPTSAQAPARIIAVGDVHGSIDGITAILKAAGLIDDSRKWIGGKATFVQTGDYTDRGDHVRAVLDLLMSLEDQAKEAGGRAVSLLGNHEVMNLVGETRDATREIFATFADANSDKRRQQAWDNYARLAELKREKGEPVPSVYAQTREAWLTTHPAGFAEYKEALSPKGKYGAWLRGKPMVSMIDGTIFMHAGIPPEHAPAKLDDLNEKLRSEIKLMDRFIDTLIDEKLATREFTLSEVLAVAASEIGLANARIDAARQQGTEPDRRKINTQLLVDAQQVLKIDSWLSINGDQALWYRGLSTLKDDPAGAPFAALLQKYGARRFVTGHTPQANRSINVRFGGRAILIDTGMLTAVYKGRPSALEISGDTLTAHYTDGKLKLQ